MEPNNKPSPSGTCAGQCRHFGFTDPAPPYGYGSNWWCAHHRKRIKNAASRCEHLRDRTTKRLPGHAGR